MGSVCEAFKAGAALPALKLACRLSDREPLRDRFRFVFGDGAALGKVVGLVPTKLAGSKTTGSRRGDGAKR